MPNDPLSPVFRGQPLAISAVAWNDVVASAAGRKRGVRPRDGGFDPAAHGPVRAMVLNDTGADLREYKPAKVTSAGGYDLTDATAGPHWADNPLLTIGTPGAATDVVAVTLEAIPDGQIGWAAVGGWTLCDVDVSNSGHHYASPTTDTDALVSGATGSIRILNTGTGTARRCAVYLGDQVAASSSAPTLTYDSEILSADHALASSSGSWEQVVTLTPGSGTWLVWYAANGLITSSSGGGYLRAALSNDGATPDTAVADFCSLETSTGTARESATGFWVVTVTSETIYLLCARVFSGTLSTSTIRGLSGQYATGIFALQLAP